jgi:hypothetical protein
MMTALLAWPWSIMLSSAESSPLTSQHRAARVKVVETVRVHRLVRSGWWDRQNCILTAPDYDRDEEEGNDDGPLSLSSALSLVQLVARTDRLGSPIESTVIRASIPLQDGLVPLRC